MSSAGRTIKLSNSAVTRTPLEISIASAQCAQVGGMADVYVKINSKDYTIIGCDESFKPTGTLYNKYICGGKFFNLERGLNEVKVEIDGVSKPLPKTDYRYAYH